MKELIYDLSEMTFFKFIWIALILFLCLRMVHKGLRSNARNRQAQSILNRIFPSFEGLVWMVFLIWGARQVFHDGTTGSILLPAILIGLFAWAGGFVLRDWISGIIVKAEDRYQKGDMICFRDARGRITHMGFRSLTLEVPDAALVEIPYGALIKENIIQKVPRETACCSFEFSVPARNNHPDLLQQLRIVLLSAPWSSLLREPRVRIIKTPNNGFKAEVTAYLVDSKYAAEIEAYVKRNIGLPVEIAE